MKKHMMAIIFACAIHYSEVSLSNPLFNQYSMKVTNHSHEGLYVEQHYDYDLGDFGFNGFNVLPGESKDSIYEFRTISIRTGICEIRFTLSSGQSHEIIFYGNAIEKSIRLIGFSEEENYMINMQIDLCNSSIIYRSNLILEIPIIEIPEIPVLGVGGR